MGFKTCTKCGVEKALSEFYYCKTNKDRLQGTCRACDVARATRHKKLRRMANPPAAVPSRIVYVDGAKRCAQCQKTKPPSAFYAAKDTPDRHHRWCKVCSDAAALRSSRRGRGDTPVGAVCDICGGVDRKRALAADHCHRTGTERGWLCSLCNTGIGMLKDSPTILVSSLRYLLKHGTAVTTADLSPLLHDLELHDNAHL